MPSKTLFILCFWLLYQILLCFLILGDCANIEHICSPQVIESTEEFEKALKKMQFLKEDTTALLKYACNVDSHFANKKCQDVIMAARNLMTSEIHNTVKVPRTAFPPGKQSLNIF